MLSGRPEDKVNIETALPSRKIKIIIIFIFFVLNKREKSLARKKKDIKETGYKTGMNENSYRQTN